MTFSCLNRVQRHHSVQRRAWPAAAPRRRRIRTPTQHRRRVMEGRGSVRRAALEETRGGEGPRGGRRKRRGGEGRGREGRQETGEGGRWKMWKGEIDRRRRETKYEKNWHHHRVVI